MDTGVLKGVESVHPVHRFEGAALGFTDEYGSARSGELAHAAPTLIGRRASRATDQLPAIEH